MIQVAPRLHATAFTYVPLSGGYGDLIMDGRAVHLLYVANGRRVHAYTRENLQRSSADHFVTSSNARIRAKQGPLNKHEVQILELAAPDDVWAEIAALVAQSDTLKRPVRRNRRWTIAKAERAFQREQTAFQPKPREKTGQLELAFAA